jgi:hypothetical protein
VSVAVTEPAAQADAAAGSAAGGMGGVGGPVREGCPLCGAPLQPAQEWCLGCGAAARTRLAATPRWRGPVIALGVVIVLALGALTASLVSLAG